MGYAGRNDQPLAETGAPHADAWERAVEEGCYAPEPGSQRLAASIDWLDLAWRNTPSLTDSARILVMKAGFEALLGADHVLANQRRALLALLGRKGRPEPSPADDGLARKPPRAGADEGCGVVVYALRVAPQHDCPWTPSGSARLEAWPGPPLLAQ
jgi:hypothetical protein